MRSSRKPRGTSMVNTLASTSTGSDCICASNVMGYAVVDQIGSGAGSVLYSVTRPGSTQLFTLKHVRRKNEKSLRFVDQLENEFKVGQKVHHPSLRRPIDFRIGRSLFRRV